MFKKLLFLFPLVLSANMFAQDTATDNDVEELVVVGSQIKGAKITGAVPVNLITSEDIEALGVDSGDDLLASIAEQGTNAYNQTDFNGGYNASRGDVGSLNLRNIGTGNTLALINGRRVINSPGYHTETVGGSFTPVLSANTNTIPVFGADRIEVLRDGASAIYGADAVAGVINTVLKSNFEGLNIRVRNIAYDSFATDDASVGVTWGKDFGNTNVSVYYDHYTRGRIQAREDPKWVDGDLRRLLPADSEYNDTTWRNTSFSNQYAQFYEGSNVFSLYAPDDPNCTSNSSSNLYTMPGVSHVCMYDSSSTRDANRASYGQWMDKRGTTDRNNLFVFVNTELANGNEAYTEFGFYKSKGNRVLYPGTFLGSGSSTRGGNGTQPISVPSTNYWLNQWERTNGDKFVDREGDQLWIRGFRFQTPRSYDSDRQTTRFVQGLRGETASGWDWDTAIVVSNGESRMLNHGRIALTLLDEALAKNTPDAFNPFCAGVNCNEEQALISIFRENTSDLYMIDFKASNPEVFEMPAGPVGLLFGTELRREKLGDIRDPNINGTIPWTGGQGAPYVSNVANSSPSPNTNGSRTTFSMFSEAQIPLASNIDTQLAIRGEKADDFGANVVGKFAMRWQLMDQVMLRASSSTSFKAPNLVVMNEGLIARNNSRTDALVAYALRNNELADSNYSIQRLARGNPDLEAEEATNTSIGFVIEPIEGMIVTYDKWKIEQENTIGLFGEENHMLLDLLIRREGGPSECTGNPLVTRAAFIADEESAGWDSNLCQAGVVQNVNDIYANLDNRTLEGSDLIVQYKFDTNIGRFSLKLNSTHYDEFYQEASGPSARIIAASSAGGLLDDPSVDAPEGFANLLGVNGFFEDKYTMNASWRNGPYQILISGTKFGEFEETAVTNNANGGDGSKFWMIESMTTYNLTLGYEVDNVRYRATVRNIEDTRAPLADEYTWGAWNDVHNDYGMNYRFEVLVKF